MDNWKHGKPFAIIVCPVYQLPSRTSQIYQQATTRSVCIATYTHLAVLVRFAQETAKSNCIELVHEVFRLVEAMNPSKDAGSYWQSVNRFLLDFNRRVSSIWREEKIAATEAIQYAKGEALTFLASERARIMSLSKEEAIREVLIWRRLEKKINEVRNVNDNRILDLGQRIK